MKYVGFPKGSKENERRISIIPKDIRGVNNPEYLIFEEGYGKYLGISDEDYLKRGCKVKKREEILKSDIICEPKIGEAEYIKDLEEKTIFGWVHAVQNRELTDALLKSKMKVYAWEDMFEESGKHVFSRNNELAGEAAVLHAIICYGLIPKDKKVAILGNGNTSRGARRILTSLGADTYIYPKKKEEKFKGEMSKFDVIVNTVMWDITRKDHIIYNEDLKKLKKKALIIDVSCDAQGAIESAYPTTMDEPIYVKDGIVHYVVDHTPSILYRDASKSISKEVAKYLDQLIEDKPQTVLEKALIIDNGEIIDKKIKVFQDR